MTTQTTINATDLRKLLAERERLREALTTIDREWSRTGGVSGDAIAKARAALAETEPTQ